MFIAEQLVPQTKVEVDWSAISIIAQKYQFLLMEKKTNSVTY